MERINATCKDLFPLSDCDYESEVGNKWDLGKFNVAFTLTNF